MFGKLVRRFRVNNGLSQAVFVDMVQRSSDKFDNLDVVTLSRWERGVTKPHLTRQNGLLELLGIDIFDVWDGNAEISDINRKLNFNCYINSSFEEDMNVTIINSTNISQLRECYDLIQVIFDSDNNYILSHLVTIESNRMSIFEKVLELHTSELVIVTVHGQLVAHLLSVDSNDLSARFNMFIEQDEPSRLIISFKVTTQFSLIETLGREVYKLMQNLNPKIELNIFVLDKVMFDVLCQLGFSYKSLEGTKYRKKIMTLTKDKVKSERVWMQIIRCYKR